MRPPIGYAETVTCKCIGRQHQIKQTDKLTEKVTC